MVILFVWYPNSRGGHSDGSVQTPTAGFKNGVKQSKPKNWKVKWSKTRCKLEKVKGQAQLWSSTVMVKHSYGQLDITSHQSTIPHPVEQL